ncbi:hypothetical protein H0H81_001867 [Sphagnurus paluster]|uniref:Uncharacterized protein n=1 Tax=Sphagnurus paluster TaxID=117069 RepID=A0A9P7K6N4_9AGAR|nr:hypothetical protein H0H81_001867 [Sphagnurus paluster]
MEQDSSPFTQNSFDPMAVDTASDDADSLGPMIADPMGDIFGDYDMDGYFGESSDSEMDGESDDSRDDDDDEIEAFEAAAEELTIGLEPIRPSLPPGIEQDVIE